MTDVPDCRCRFCATWSSPESIRIRLAAVDLIGHDE